MKSPMQAWPAWHTCPISRSCFSTDQRSPMPAWSISSRLQQLEFLGIQHTRVTGSGLVHLQGLANLAWLDLSYTQIGDPELKQLEKLSQTQSRGSLRHPGLPGRHPQNPSRPAPLHGALSLIQSLMERASDSNLRCGWRDGRSPSKCSGTIDTKPRWDTPTSRKGASSRRRR